MSLHECAGIARVCGSTKWMKRGGKIEREREKEIAAKKAIVQLVSVSVSVCLPAVFNSRPSAVHTVYCVQAILTNSLNSLIKCGCFDRSSVFEMKRNPKKKRRKKCKLE